MSDASSQAFDDWFVREILPHEPVLTRVLGRLWRRTDELADLRQETLIRVYEAARKSYPHNPRAFLLATARNLVADRIRRDRVVSLEALADLDDLNVLVEERTPERHVSVRQEVRRLADAVQCLPPRCREVVVLRKVKQLSQREVAEALRIAESTVEKQVAKGMQLLAQWLGEDHPSDMTTGDRLRNEKRNRKLRRD